jgi:hypothetical protein
MEEDENILPRYWKSKHHSGCYAESRIFQRRYPELALGNVLSGTENTTSVLVAVHFAISKSVLYLSTPQPTPKELPSSSLSSQHLDSLEFPLTCKFLIVGAN